MLNSFNVMGRLAADPEMKKSNEGKDFATFRVANNTGKEEVNWINCICFGKTAENVARYTQKGKELYIEGRLQTRKWEDRDGNNRYSTEVVANKVDFIGPRSEPREQEAPQQQAVDDNVMPF